MSVTPQDMFYVNLPTFCTLQRALWVQLALHICVESGKATKRAMLTLSVN